MRKEEEEEKGVREGRRRVERRCGCLAVTTVWLQCSLCSLTPPLDITLPEMNVTNL